MPDAPTPLGHKFRDNKGRRNVQNQYGDSVAGGQNVPSPLFFSKGEGKDGYNHHIQNQP